MSGGPRAQGPHPALPLADADCDDLFNGLSRNACLILAVSGGSDSIALLHSVVAWHNRHPDPARTIVVATVDHGLRINSRAEAKMVANQAHGLGLAHHQLTWDGEKPATGLQEAARAARYELLQGLAKSLPGRPLAIVTAHTEDDQAETLLMRLARGSGVSGLAAMRPLREISNGIFIVRPLLGVPKHRLIATCLAVKAETVDDPSNHDPRFERIRWRDALTGLGATGLTSHALALSAERLGRADDALNAMTSEVAERLVAQNHGAFAEVDGAAFAVLTTEIRIRLLMRLLGAYGGSAPPAELSQIEALVARLERGGGVNVTLGGTMVRACDKRLRVFREVGRTVPESHDIQAGENLVWDRRFLITAGDIASSLSIRGLGATPYAALRHRLPKQAILPARAAATLPSVWRGSTLVAVPGLDMGDGPGPAISASFIYDRYLQASWPSQSP